MEWSIQDGYGWVFLPLVIEIVLHCIINSLDTKIFTCTGNATQCIKNCI